MKKLYFFVAGASALALSLGAYALTTAPLTALSASAVVTAEAGLSLVNTTPANNAIIPLWNIPTEVTFRFSAPVEVNRNSGLVVKVIKPYMFGEGGTEMASYPASDESRIYVNPANPRELLVKVEGIEFSDVSTGYKVILEEGLVSGDGASNSECETRFYFQDTFRWTTNPASGSVLNNAAEDLQNVSVTYSGDLTSVGLADIPSWLPKIILYRANSETGTREPVGLYTPSTDGLTLNLALTVAPGMEVTDVTAPESYEIDVPSGVIMFYNGEDYKGGNLPVLIDGLKCEGAASEWADLSEYVTYNVPGDLEANPTNTRTLLGETAMGVLSLGLKTTNIEGVAGSEKINYYYSATADGEKTLLKSIESANESEVLIIGVGAMEDNDPGLLEFTPVNYLYMMFASSGDGELDQEAIKSVYSKDGYYTLDIPDGAFIVEGMPARGLTLTYHYDSTPIANEFEYTLIPSPETVINDPVKVFSQSGSGITLEVANASMIDSRNKSATLQLPDGTSYTPVTAKTNYKNQLTWKFGTGSTVWPDGEYVFTVAPNKVGVNMGFEDDWDSSDECNFPGLTAIYHVDTLSAILLVGAEPAATYTVVTLDGKVVKSNVALSELHDLESGIYVVNGKKTVLRK
ncbi:MAG: hypothetical protein K2M31_01070 [Muribaculaceae bacterium]|nr:hypothetical protein [Muribaculaceae bacterium]